MATLEEKGAAFRLGRLTFKSPEHLALHPFGRIPIFEHDGFRLYETQAILRYLDRILPTPALTPTDPKHAARMDQVMNVNDWYLFQGVGNVIIFHRVVGPRVMGTTPDEDAIRAAMPKAHVVFEELARLLAQQPYFAGDAISLADLMIAPAMEFFTQTPEWSALGAPHANLVAWLARMQARPSMKATTWERLSAISEAA
jgi:glutathione S-transferase